MSRFLCSDAARARHEPTLGTASRVDRWLLVEAPGAWGPRALPETRSIDDNLLLTLQQRAKQAHARTLLIRRSGRSALAGRRWIFAADSRPSHEMLLSRQVTDDELRSLELPYDGATDGWQISQSLIAVCTHGRHDACCAVRARPVAAALAQSHADITWETSHLGGDRFAANALVLPAGHYLGQLPPETAGRLVDDLLSGSRPDPYYRGRSCWAAPIQAALSLAATRFNETRLEALRPSRLERLGPHSWRVEIERPGTGTQAVVVEVEQSRGPEMSLLTCRATDEQPTPSWHLTSIA